MHREVFEGLARIVDGVQKSVVVKISNANDLVAAGVGRLLGPTCRRPLNSSHAEFVTAPAGRPKLVFFARFAMLKSGPRRAVIARRNKGNQTFGGLAAERSAV